MFICVLFANKISTFEHNVILLDSSKKVFKNGNTGNVTIKEGNQYM